MSAQILRDAADRLDALADEASGAPWTIGPNGYIFGHIQDGKVGGTIRIADAAYIAAMSPTVGKALAAWLRTVAVAADLTGAPIGDEVLAVARAVLGRAS